MFNFGRWDFHLAALALGGISMDTPKGYVRPKDRRPTKLVVRLPHRLRTRRDDNRRVIER